MIPRLLLCILLGFSLAACTSTAEKEKKAKEKAEKKEPSIPDMANDPTFQAFIGRLGEAAAHHDMAAIAPMMTSDFGYKLPDGEGDGVFQYWDQQNVWPQIIDVFNKGFAPKGNFMVAPPEFAAHPSTYHGYRAGITLINGAWKFAYFVNDQP